MSRWMKYALPVVLIATLLVLPTTQVFAAPNAPTYVSDEFNNGTTLNPVWTPVTGVTGQTITQTGGHAVITAPAGSDQTIYSNTPTNTAVLYNAPRLMQAFGGTGDEDFGIEVKFDSIPTQKFQQEGIAIEKSTNDVLRFEFYSDGVNLHLLGMHVYMNGATPSVPTMVDMVIPIDQVTGASSLYMRITRTSFIWILSYKTSTMTDFVNATWKTNSVPPDIYTITKVGVYAGTSGGATAPGFTANVDYFHNTAAPAITFFNLLLPVAASNQ